MPMEMAPAMSSATPPNTTSFDSPRDESPAVRANGTVSPSESPITLFPVVSFNTKGESIERTCRGRYRGQ